MPAPKPAEIAERIHALYGMAAKVTVRDEPHNKRAGLVVAITVPGKGAVYNTWSPGGRSEAHAALAAWLDQQEAAKS